MTKKKKKRINNDPQNTTVKSKEWATWALLKPGLKSGSPEEN